MGKWMDGYPDGWAGGLMGRLVAVIVRPPFVPKRAIEGQGNQIIQLGMVSLASTPNLSLQPKQKLCFGV